MSTAYQDQIVWNGTLMSADAARVSPLSEGLMFGRGLFETLRVVRGRPAFLPEHFARLKRSCTAVGLTWEINEEALRSRCLDVIGANALVSGVLKILVFADLNGTGELLATRDFVYPKTKYAEGFRLQVQTCARTARHGAGASHKTTSYLENLLARERAKAAGFDDALLVDVEGQVLEGAATNVFAVVGNLVFTPPEDFGLLPGIVRSEILKRGADLGMGVQTSPITKDALLSADEVFVTNALIGVMPVAAVDDRVFDFERYEVTRRLMREYQEWLVASL